MNVIFDVLPWEPISLFAGLGFVITAIGNVIGLLRKGSVSRFRWLLLAIFGAGAVWPWITIPNFGTRMQRSSQTNIADTNENNAELGLVPRRYQAPPHVVAATIPGVVEQLGWRLISSDETQFTIEVPLPVRVFTDDFRVTLTAEDGTTIVNARSSSRVGRGDLGENRRHIVQFFGVLDERLANQ